MDEVGYTRFCKGTRLPQNERNRELYRLICEDLGVDHENPSEENIEDVILSYNRREGALAERTPAPKRSEIEAEPTPFWEYENQRLADKWEGVTGKIWEGVTGKIRHRFLGSEKPLTRGGAEAWLKGKEENNAQVVKLIVSREQAESMLMGGAAKDYSFVPTSLLGSGSFDLWALSEGWSREGDGAFSMAFLHLPYYNPRGKPRSVTCGYFLARLLAECEYLSEHMGWALIDVVDWVLCGKTPKNSLRISSHIPYADRPYPPTFTMKGDLRASSQEVARLYQRAKEDLEEQYEEVRQYYRVVRQGPQIDETAGEDNLAFSYMPGRARRTGLLLSFVDETPQLSWSERLREWNARYPQFGYGSVNSMKVVHSRASKPLQAKHKNPRPSQAEEP